VGAHEGLRAPGFSALLASGGTLSSSDLRGKPAVLVFWASWCGPCRYEVPHVNQLDKSVGETAHVLGINAGEDHQTVLAAIKAMDIQYPVLEDSDGRISKAYEATSLPLLVVVDPDGRVRYRGSSFPARLSAFVAQLRKEGPT